MNDTRGVWDGSHGTAVNTKWSLSMGCVEFKVKDSNELQIADAR